MLNMDSGNSRFAGISYSEPRKCLLRADGTEIKLRPKSLSVFQCLAAQPDTVISKENIFSVVWGDIVVTDDSLTKCISDIRRVLQDDNHEVLRTIPRHGYMLVPDKPVVDKAVVGDTGEPSTAGIAQANSTKTPLSSNRLFMSPLSLIKTYRWVLIILASVLVGLVLQSFTGTQNKAPVALSTAGSGYTNPPEPRIPDNQSEISDDSIPSISVEISDGPSKNGNELLAAIAIELRIALTGYRTIVVSEADNSDYVLKLITRPAGDGDPKAYIELIHEVSGSLLMGHTFEPGKQSTTAAIIARRTAGMVASPGGGAIGRHLMRASRDKPEQELSRAECIAHGYDCTNCSGELDSITEKAEACLSRLLQENPNDAQAWALQSTLYSHQYAFGSTLAEPQRSHLPSRAHLPDKAIQAATRAEEISGGGDSAVYWALAQAYSASCQIDKLRATAQRGLEISPHDPGLLAAFGNWIAYTGHWDEGVAMVEKALEIEPRYYKKWWLFGLAKRHYSRGEYQQAYDLFIRAFNEHNWLSHLQLAYTLPHLGRIEEARQSLKHLLKLAPSITLEYVLQFYKTYCFPNPYVENIKSALLIAGMPSRGNSENLEKIDAIHAEVLSIGDYKVEYMDVGDGVPVLFVHGAISDYRTWAFFQNPVSEKYRYISYSRRYFGSQEWPDDGENSGFDIAATDLIAFIEALDIAPVFAVSWSSGGPITNLAASIRPELFQGLIHYEPAGDDSVFSEDELEKIARDRDKFYSTFDRADEYLEKKDYQNNVKAVLEAVFEMQPGDFEKEIMPLRRVLLDSWRTQLLQDKPSQPVTCELLNRIRIPAVVVRGSRTNRYWSERSRIVSECMPNASLVTMEGVNHDGPIRDPQAIYAVIDQFIQKHR